MPSNFEKIQKLVRVSVAYLNPLGALLKLIRLSPFKKKLFKTLATLFKKQTNIGKQTQKQTNKNRNKQTKSNKQTNKQQTNKHFCFVKRTSQSVLPINIRNLPFHPLGGSGMP